MTLRIYGGLGYRYLSDGKIPFDVSLSDMHLNIEQTVWNTIHEIGYDVMSIDFLRGYLAVFHNRFYSYKQIRDALFRLKLKRYPLEHLRHGVYEIAMIPSA